MPPQKILIFQRIWHPTRSSIFLSCIYGVLWPAAPNNALKKCWNSLECQETSETHMWRRVKQKRPKPPLSRATWEGGIPIKLRRTVGGMQQYIWKHTQWRKAIWECSKCTQSSAMRQHSRTQNAQTLNLEFSRALLHQLKSTIKFSWKPSNCLRNHCFIFGLTHYKEHI